MASYCSLPPTGSPGPGRRLATCFTDLQVADIVRPSVPDLLRQRIFGIALGHEDLIDHGALRDDPALAAVLDKPGDRLAGKSTLNRLEHAGKIGSDRHHKLDHDAEAIERLIVDLFIDAYDRPPSRMANVMPERSDETLRFGAQCLTGGRAD